MAQRVLSAMAALVLGAWIFPSAAATGTGTDARSEQPLDAPPLSLSADPRLPVQALDHRAALPESLPLDEAANQAPQDAAGQPQGPRVETMLRRIFDEAQARQPTLRQAHEDDDRSAPLAVDKSDTLEDTPRLLDADPAEAAAQLPGLGADDLLRYRQQMYRTDI